MIDRDLNRLNQSDVYSIICELLYALRDDASYGVLSELAYILDKDSFVRFIKYFGGTTITVPTLDEFKATIKVIQLYHYFNIENMSCKDALVKAGFDKSETRTAQRKLMAFTKTLNSVKIGRSYD